MASRSRTLGSGWNTYLGGKFDAFSNVFVFLVFFWEDLGFGELGLEGMENLPPPPYEILNTILSQTMLYVCVGFE